MKVYKEKVNLSCQGMYLKTQRAEPQYKGYRGCRLCSCVTEKQVTPCYKSGLAQRAWKKYQIAH